MLAREASSRSDGGVHVLFHDDFDGVASAVLAVRLLQEYLGLNVVAYRPVNYSVRPTWLSQQLPVQTAIVDFLFHPTATYWWDHHATTFLDQAMEREYRQRPPRVFWDPRASSCARMLERLFAKHHGFRRPELENLITWADRIDSATYDSPSQAVDCLEPALQINLGLLLPKKDAYLVWLVSRLLREPLDAVAARDRAQERYREAKARQSKALDEFRVSASLAGGIVSYDVVERRGRVFNRYFPYYVYPEGYASVGCVRRSDSLKITAMFNPWRRDANGRRQHLGRWFSQYGGGGHPRVGSVVLPPSEHVQVAGIMRAARSVLERSCTTRRVHAHV